MIMEIFGLPGTPANQFFSLVLGGLVFYFGMSGLSYLIFFVWGRKKFHPSYQPNEPELRAAYKWGVLGVLGNAFLMVPFHLAIAHGYSRVYTGFFAALRMTSKVFMDFLRVLRDLRVSRIGFGSQVEFSSSPSPR